MPNIKKDVEKEYLENAIDYCKGSLELEREREKIINKSSNTIITSCSILLVPLITVIIELLNKLDKIRIVVLIFGLILVALELVSLLLAINAQNLYKSVYTQKGKDLFEYMVSQNAHEEDNYYLIQKIEDLDRVLEQKINNNNKRRNYLVASKIVNYIFCFLLIEFTIVILLIK